MKANTKKFMAAFEALIQIELDLGIIGDEAKEYTKYEKLLAHKQYKALIKKALEYQSKVTQEEYENYVQANEYIVEYCHEDTVEEWIENGIPFSEQDLTR